jgi:nucleoid DNA-binding protein
LIAAHCSAIFQGIDMATKKAATPKTATKKAPAKIAAKAPSAAPAIKPIKDAFTKAGLAAHLAETAEVELKTVKKVLAALEVSVLGSLHKKGLGEFALPGLLKIVAQKVPAKPRRFGKNPFTGQEQWFPAKKASVRVKVRPLKKLKDAPQ